MKFAVMITAALGVTAVPVSAQSGIDIDTFSKAYQDCIFYGETHNTLAIPAGECNSRELTRQDARLNQAYKMVMARLPAKRKIDLRTDERNWIAARDAKCHSLRDPDDQAECLISETMIRVRYLERYR